MKESDDGKMLYLPASVEVQEGQTVRFAIRNAGETDREFVLGTHEEIMEHKKVMEKSPRGSTTTRTPCGSRPASPARSSGSSPNPEP